ncbi:Putative phospholipase d/transphosphatidylase protein [Mycoavidus cysteinexigens]|uniref:phospholipase D n=1 Tax=Mycoavidus cysteinexigens TaxID=1553431 RepID=A0A2Z6EXL7_9BURK|nr:phospholipase D family protein [Mycoavidus cysteinexigens]BBE10186.1 Putative phospholipase d/transphosphatidylase protein [Mycoavidus cysteinexigens]GAM53455.1 putative endonuclease protein [bacterium endosymbiont of Mortierella elongata FMR23-6]GLR00603.1 hypothetical protein GCM10007934_04140 [Mycoavidus cysteinexigens]
MKLFFSLSGLLVLVASLVTASDARGPVAYTPPLVLKAQGTMQAAFVPRDDVEGLIVDALQGARKQVLVQAYLLSNKRIIQALMKAHERGVEVRILVDAGRLEEGRDARITALAKAGIWVRREVKYRNAHNKIIIIDANSAHSVLITGSFNFTHAAQRKNAENMLIIRDFPALVHEYAKNWQRHADSALTY